MRTAASSQLVPEERRAWHAGVSNWQGRARLNDCSIGIELVNPGHEWGYRPFTEAQYDACIALCRAILARWPIPPGRVLAHSDVAPARKQDPGELFDWPRLAAAGIGLWPPPGAGRTASPSHQLQSDLARLGYEVAPGGRLGCRRRDWWSRPSSATSARHASTAARPGDARPSGRSARACCKRLKRRLAGPTSSAGSDGRMAAPGATRGRKVRAPRKHGAG